MAGSLRMRNHSHNNWRENPNGYGTSGGLIQTIHLPVTLFLWVKWRATASVNSRVVVNHCWKNSSSSKALWYECNTPLKMPLLRVWSIVIASVVIELAWLKERRKKEEEDRRFGRLATYRCGTPAMVSGNANTLVAHENTREWLVWLTKVYDCI